MAWLQALPEQAQELGWREQEREPQVLAEPGWPECQARGPERPAEPQGREPEPRALVRAESFAGRRALPGPEPQERVPSGRPEQELLASELRRVPASPEA